MITFMAEKQIYGANIIIQISFEKGHFTTGSVYIYGYTNMVIRVTAIDTHES